MSFFWGGICPLPRWVGTDRIVVGWLSDDTYIFSYLIEFPWLKKPEREWKTPTLSFVCNLVVWAQKYHPAKVNTVRGKWPSVYLNKSVFSQRRAAHLTRPR